jgi:hypothetical protein
MDRLAALTFLGSAGTVTGSEFRVDAGDHQVLVDAGLFQGRGCCAGATGSAHRWTCTAWRPWP